MYTIVYTAGVGEEMGTIHQIVKATIESKDLPAGLSVSVSGSIGEMEIAADGIDPTWRSNFDIRFYPIKVA